LKFQVHQSAVVDKGAQIGEGTRIWHFCHVMEEAVIGRNCNIGQNVFIDNGVVIGNGVKIQNNVSIYKGVVVEDDVFLGPSKVITNVMNPRSFIDRKQEIKTTHVGRGVTVGANATIVCGVEIGSFAFVGAGAVITKNVLPFALMTGNPAQQAGWVSEHGYKLSFENNNAFCIEEKQHYRLKNNTVEKS
jgi:UDP-2-acetamido-3-amino-2,3-dideoxy-glucuronate N-acetyltransferase